SDRAAGGDVGGVECVIGADSDVRRRVSAETRDDAAAGFRVEWFFAIWLVKPDAGSEGEDAAAGDVSDIDGLVTGDREVSGLRDVVVGRDRQHPARSRVKLYDAQVRFVSIQAVIWAISQPDQIQKACFTIRAGALCMPPYAIACRFFCAVGYSFGSAACSGTAGDNFK